MVEPIIDKHLKLFDSRSVLSETPVTGWTFRLAQYREIGDYEFLTDWEPLVPETIFSTTQTVFAKTAFVPQKPGPGQTAYLELVTTKACEAFVSVNGKRYAGINSDQGRIRVYLPGDCFGKETGIGFELFASRHSEPEFSDKPVYRCSWKIVDDVLLDFARNMTFLREVTENLEDGYLKCALRDLLENTIRKTDLSLEGAEYRASVEEINAGLKNALAELKKDDHAGEVDFIASTHIDVAWLWQYKDTVRKSGRSALNQLRIMDRYPEFEFSMSQPSLYAYIKKEYPEVFEQIKAKVAEGSWKLVGPMWVESDLNLSCAESLVREFLYGHAFFQKEFGKTSDMCWIPDSFGFPANLPQIFAKCGTKNFYTTKVRWQAGNTFPYNVFVWEGLDGSRLLSTVPWTESYYNGVLNAEEVLFAARHNQQKALWDKTLFVYGLGDGGGGPTEEMLENFRRIREMPGMPRVKLTDTDTYFGGLSAKKESLPVWKGELCVETHQGTYTSVARNKRNNRYAEMAFRRLDLLCSLARRKAPDTDYSEIVRNWKDLLLMQFHDVLPGSSITPVYEDTDRMYANLFAFAEQKQKELEKAVFESDGSGDFVTVFNPNSFEASAYVPLGTGFTGLSMESDGHSSPVLTGPDGSASFYVDSLPGFSSRVYRKSGKSVPAKKAVVLTPCGTDYTVDTPYFTFSLHEDGTLHDFFDKREKVILSAGEGFNNFVTYKDGPETEDAWNIDKEYKLRGVDMQWQNRLDVIESAPERAVIRLTKVHSDTVLSVDITVYADIARVDFFGHIDWQEKYKILQVSFPTTIFSQQASYEIAYGNVKRPTHANTPAERWKHEYAAHRYTDLSDEVRGVALLNDCKYGHNVIDSDLIMTLFRNTDYPSDFRDTGKHDFSYALYPHSGNVKGGCVTEQAYLFNSPLLTLPGRTEFACPFALSDNGLILDCVKPSEDGAGTILRFYEPCGVSGQTEIKLDSAARIREVTPLEEPLSDLGTGDRFTVSFKPFEFRTFRLDGALTK